MSRDPAWPGRWRTVTVLAITETVSWGILYYAFAVVLEPMERELGWTRLQLTAAFSLALAAAAVGGVGVGRWLDRHGPRGLMGLGSLAGAALVLAWSRVSGLGALYVIWAGIGLCMAAVLYEPAFTVVTKWFRERRRRALTAITLAAGFASTIFSPLTAWLVDLAGWRGALAILAGVLAAITVPLHVLGLRRPPPEVRDDRQETAREPVPEIAVPARTALRSLSFWLLTAAFFLSSFNTAAIGVHLVALLIGRGESAGLAATIAGLVGAAQVLGRIVFGPLTTVLAHRWATAAVFLFQAAGLAVLARPMPAGAAVAFAVLFGMGNGMTTLARPMLLAEAYGSAHFGTIAGVAALFATGARAVAPVTVSLAYAAAGGYTSVLWALLGAAVVAALAGYLAVRRAEGAAQMTPSALSSASASPSNPSSSP
jgi:MFS family permease